MKKFSRESLSVAVIEWNWVGHHPTYFSHMVLAFEEQGCNVLAICTEPEQAHKSIEELRQHYNLGPRAKGVSEFRQLILPTQRLTRILRGSIGAIDLTIRRFRAIEAIAKRWQHESGKTLDLIFYACIYDWDFQWFRYAKPFLSFPWSGLYLHAWSFRMPGRPHPKTKRLPCPEQIFSGPLCRGVTILDEAVTIRFAAATSKPVSVMPDMIDCRLPQVAQWPLAQRLKQWAKGRPIVGLFGYLQPSKGMVPLLLASQDPRLSHVCFAFGGEIEWPLFSSEERRTICDTLSNGQNTWNHLMQIRDGEPMNSLLSSSDILCASYLDFPHSSNIMTKAALLQKPLIVSDGYLMAERVRNFRMGEVIQQGDGEALVAAILKLTDDSATWIAKTQPRWTDYLHEHSYERLIQTVREILAWT
ncbi:MAG: hypothetical protein WCK77_15540 [Verrucomicrobiota bacterium]